MIEIWTVMTITILAVISPGADFAMVTRNSILYGRSAGLWSSLGIALGVQLHVFYTMIGVGLIIRNSPNILILLKILGAFYLIYIGFKTYFDTLKNATAPNGDIPQKIKSFQDSAFKMGFLTNALNPKTTLFVLSIYSQIVDPKTPLIIQFSYGVFMSFAHLLWFSLITIFLSNNDLRKKLLQQQIVVNKVIGSILILLGILLAIPSNFFH